MDWLDNYLDGLGQYKVTVSPSDTHVWGVKPKLNNIQQKMLFDAAAQSELEYRLIVQEAREAEIDAGMGGGYDAGSAAREKRPVTPPVPSGIPTATTTIVNISIVSSGFNDNFVKANPNTWYSTELTFEFQFGQWYVRDSESGVYTINTSPNQTVGYIPLTGWSPADTTITVVA